MAEVDVNVHDLRASAAKLTQEATALSALKKNFETIKSGIRVDGSVDDDIRDAATTTVNHLRGVLDKVITGIDTAGKSLTSTSAAVSKHATEQENNDLAGANKLKMVLPKGAELATPGSSSHTKSRIFPGDGELAPSPPKSQGIPDDGDPSTSYT